MSSVTLDAWEDLEQLLLASRDTIAISQELIRQSRATVQYAQRQATGADVVCARSQQLLSTRHPSADARTATTRRP